MKELIGKTVVSLEVNECENVLVFNCTDDKVVYIADRHRTANSE